MSNDGSLGGSSCRRDAPALAQMIAISGARPSDNIVIAGAGELDLLIALTREGFENLACHCVARGPHFTPKQSDLILAPAIRSEAELAAVLRWFGPKLRGDGTIILRLADCFARTDKTCLHGILLNAGFDDIEQLGSCGGTLWRARKQASALARAA